MNYSKTDTLLINVGLVAGFGLLGIALVKDLCAQHLEKRFFVVDWHRGGLMEVEGGFGPRSCRLTATLKYGAHVAQEEIFILKGPYLSDVTQTEFSHTKSVYEKRTDPNDGLLVKEVTVTSVRQSERPLVNGRIANKKSAERIETWRNYLATQCKSTLLKGTGALVNIGLT